jgi:hypothetical protein
MKPRSPRMVDGSEGRHGQGDAWLSGGQLTFIADRRVWSDDRFLGTGCFVLGEEGRRDGQTADLVLLGQIESEPLRVVIDVLHARKLQIHEALFPTRESLRRIRPANSVARRVLARCFRRRCS